MNRNPNPYPIALLAALTTLLLSTTKTVASRNSGNNVVLDKWSWDDNEIQILGQAILKQQYDQEEHQVQVMDDLHSEDCGIDERDNHAFAAAASSWLQNRKRQRNTFEQQNQERGQMRESVSLSDVNESDVQRLSSDWYDASLWEEEAAKDEDEVQNEFSSRLGVDMEGVRSNPELDEFDLFRTDGNKRPVLYRYFNRVRARRRVETSVPFILLGSGNVDHWTKLGKALSANGFNVIACELQIDDESKQSATNNERVDGPELVAAVLDALRWRKAIVVGCGKAGALAALEAEERLGAEEVAGVVLVGDLIELQPFLLEEMPELDPRHPRLLDEYLLRYVKCPSTIVWDGNVAALKKRGTIEANLRFPEEAYDALRSVVLGGGEAPHRRTPEQLAWVLTRFVEEKVDGRSNQSSKMKSRHSSDIRPSESYRRNHSETLDDYASRAILFGLDLKETIMSPESLLVSGRLIAYAMMYVAFGKAAVAQYRTFQSGVSAVQFSCNQLSKWQQQFFGFLMDLFCKDWQRRIRFIRLLLVPLKILRFPRINRNRGKDATDNVESKDNSGEKKDDLKALIKDDEDIPFIFRFGSYSV